LPTAHHFIYLEGDLMLDWQTASGSYEVYRNNEQVDV